MTKVRLIFGLTAFAVLLAMSTAQANIVTPGGPNVSPDALSLPVGSTLTATITGAYLSATLNGTYTDSVYTTPTGTIDFVLAVSNVVGSQAVTEVTNGVFSTLYTYDVGDDTTTLGTQPTDVGESASDVIHFNFGGAGIAPPGTSNTLLIVTNATTYTLGSIGIIDSSTSTVPGFAEAAEPGTMALLGLVLLGGLLYERKKVFA